MPNLDEFLKGTMMSGEKPETLNKTYEGLRAIVNDNCNRKIRYVEAGGYTLEQRFEKIMDIHKKCKRQLDFLDSTMLLLESREPETVSNQQERAKAYEELSDIVNENYNQEMRFIEAGSYIGGESFEDIQVKREQQLAFLDMAMLLFERYSPEAVGEQREMARAS